MSNVFVESAILQGWADTIREKTGTDEKMKPDVLLQKTQNEWGNNGDNVNPFEYATGFEFLFNTAVFPNGTEYTLNVPNFKEGANRVCRYVEGLKKFVLQGNKTDNETTLQYAFQQRTTTELEEIDFSEWGSGGIKVTYLNNAFSDAIKLHTIKGFFDFTKAININGAFLNTPALVNVTFKSNTLSKSISFANSPLLSDASIQYVIDGLTDIAGQTSQTITFHPDVIAKLTDAQKLNIINKNWTLAQKG